jgi:hypothetical protein
VNPSGITCPDCGFVKPEAMPEDACEFFYQCSKSCRDLASKSQAELTLKSSEIARDASECVISRRTQNTDPLKSKTAKICSQQCFLISSQPESQHDPVIAAFTALCQPMPARTERGFVLPTVT